MIIAVEDTSYRCKDCDSFGLCEYYNNRRPTSHICTNFTNDSKVAEILNKISAEINTPNRGTCDYFIVDRIEEIISEYREGDSE